MYNKHIQKTNSRVSMTGISRVNMTVKNYK